MSEAEQKLYGNFKSFVRTVLGPETSDQAIADLSTGYKIELSRQHQAASQTGIKSEAFVMWFLSGYVFGSPTCIVYYSLCLFISLKYKSISHQFIQLIFPDLSQLFSTFSFVLILRS
jgi:hypothetical protein